MTILLHRGQKKPTVIDGFEIWNPCTIGQILSSPELNPFLIQESSPTHVSSKIRIKPVFSDRCTIIRYGGYVYIYGTDQWNPVYLIYDQTDCIARIEADVRMFKTYYSLCFLRIKNSIPDIWEKLPNVLRSTILSYLPCPP